MPQRVAKSKIEEQAFGVSNYVMIAIVWIAVVVSALGVIYSTHTTRQSFYELQSLEKQSNELQVEWGQLLLEKSTQAAQVRIERVAQKELGMVAPSLNAVVVVK